jgi:hypothetical protein
MRLCKGENMGCDIHPAIEYKTSEGWKTLLIPNKYYGQWEDEPELTARIPVGRNYNLFAILGNVRNEEGFNYISDSRGLPEDITPETKSALSDEHSQTYVTLLEILNFDWTQVITHSGLVDQNTFERWDRMKSYDLWPKSWCGGTSGKKITNDEMRERIKNNADPNEFIHTNITWQTTYADAASLIWKTILPPMLKLGTEYGFENVRLVMDFDS